MASNAKCIFFLLLTLCFSFQTHARDSKFFSKVSKTTKENHDSISVSPAQAPTLSPSPSPEPEVVEHGYGLYGQDSYQNYEYSPTTTNPTKVRGEGEKFLSGEELSKNNFRQFGDNEKQGMSDTRFLENGKYYYDPNQDVKDESSYFQNNGNGNGNGIGYERERERQGMSDTRFLENGKYYHDINEEEKNNRHFNSNNYANENFEDEEEENDAHFNTNNFENENEFENENFEDEKNGKYYYDGRMATKEGKNGRFEIENHGNENSEAEKRGMSDTRYLENGKYYYDVENDKYGSNHMFNNFNNNNNNKNRFGVEDVGFHSNDNVEYANSYKGNGNENNGYETQGRGGYDYNHNEYGYNNNGVKPKKYANVYDSMEEYDREQGYIDGQDNYVP